MQNIREYIKLHNETIIKFIVLLYLNTFSVLIYHEKNNIFSLIYMIFSISITIRIFFNKINV